MAVKGLHRSIKTEFKEGVIPWNKGITFKRKPNPSPRSEEWKNNLSVSIKKGYAEGRKVWCDGLPSEMHPRWAGGKSSVTNRIRTSEKYIQWRADIFKRDGWTCQTCGLRGHGKDIEAHHLVPLKQILKEVLYLEDVNQRFQEAMNIPLLFDLDNGVTLCNKCHILTHKKETQMKAKLFSLFVVALLLFGVTTNSYAISIPVGEDAKGGPAIWTIPVYNNSGSTMDAGDVAVWDIGSSTGDNDNYVTTTTTADTTIVAGVIYPQDIAAGDTGTMAVHGTVLVDASGIGLNSVGGPVCSSATAGAARSCVTNASAFALVTAVSDGTNATVFINGRN